MTLDLSIDEAVAGADVPVLLVTVAHHTGDLSILREEFRPDISNLFDPDAGITPDKAEAARALAAEALRTHRKSGAPAAPPPTDGQVLAMITYLVGEEAARDYLPILLEELSLPGTDPRAPGWHMRDIAPDTAFNVAIIGAGMSGIAAAHRLRQAGIGVTIFDKNDDVGGTWLENTYPGCRVDVPSHLYSYSFAQDMAWPGFFSAQDSLLEYFRKVSDELGLRECMRLGAEVTDVTFDEDTQTWTLEVKTSAGTETHTANAVVSAVGQLNRPKWPDIEGRDDYQGVSFHSARWEHDVDLRGKKVGVIGTGASAAQFIPSVADQAAELTIYQRTAPWFAPTPNYHDDLPGGVRSLIEEMPEYTRWDRLWLFWRTHEGLLSAAKVDPDWPDRSKSVSMMNEMVRVFLTELIRAEFPDDEELFEKATPDYPPIAKRIVRDNGSYTGALRKPHVDLNTTPIDRITATGVRTTDGEEREFDVLIYGTGFSASRFLMPMQVTGRDGINLHEHWAGDARAYLGLTIPHFPNLFLMYGPNTNIVINGSIIFFSECETHYIVESIRMLLENNHKAMDVKPEVHDAYNVDIDEANLNMAWGASSANTWYKNEKGRITQNWPFSLQEYWERTRVPNPDDYRLT